AAGRWSWRSMPGRGWPSRSPTAAGCCRTWRRLTEHSVGTASRPNEGSAMRRRVITALLFAASASAVWLRAAPEPAASQRTVYLIGEGVAEADIVAVSAALAGGGKPGVLLLDSPRAEAVVKPFLARYRPDRVVA